ncbi:MAG: hypothetical protein P8Y14_21530 [Anaerolineales bacterium]
MPYSPEYKAGGSDLGLLAELARLTGGSALAEPDAAFVHDLPVADYAREIWRPLLLIAALLFPLDVGLRRIMLGASDVHKARDWLRARLPRLSGGAARGERVLGRLFQARERARMSARGRTGAGRAEPYMSPARSEDAAEDQPAGASEPSPSSKPPPAASSEDTLARLREAKKRARREE